MKSFLVGLNPQFPIHPHGQEFISMLMFINDGASHVSTPGVKMKLRKLIRSRSAVRRAEQKARSELNQRSMWVRINERCLINTHETSMNPSSQQIFIHVRPGKCERVCVSDLRAILPLYNSYQPPPAFLHITLLQWCIQRALTQSLRAHYELGAMPHAASCSWGSWQQMAIATFCVVFN